MVANPLIGYAFLKVNFTESVRDILDLTLPLMRRALHQWKGKYVTTDVLQQKIEDVWGMVIPQYVLRSLLPRLRDQGLLSFDVTQKLYKIFDIQTGAAKIIQREKDAQAIYNRTLSSVNSEILREGLTSITGREVLELYLDRGSLAITSQENTPRSGDNNDVVSARIIAKITGAFSENPNEQVLKDVEDLLVGDLLYKAICAISEGDTFDPLSQKMTDVKVFLDTGVLFRCLGYFGLSYERPAQEMLDIFRATGCALHAFEHNVEEVVEGLMAVAGRLYTGGAYGPIVSYVMENGINRADLIERAQSVRQVVLSYGIAIDEIPPRTTELSIDERQLDWRVEIDVKQNNPNARRRDVDSLAAIYRLRDGKPQKTTREMSCGFCNVQQISCRRKRPIFQRIIQRRGPPEHRPAMYDGRCAHDPTLAQGSYKI